MEGKEKAEEIDYWVGNTIKQRRISLNMTQEYVAKKS